MQLNKRISALPFAVYLLFALCLLFAVSMPVFARQMPDSSETCSVSITMSYDGAGVPGGTLTLYRVGSAVEENGNYSYVSAGDFAECDADFSDLSAADLVNDLAAYAESENLNGTTMEIDRAGKAVFSDLEPGLYLIVQNRAADGYEALSPFLVSLPVYENGSYVYDADASPKVELRQKTKTEAPPSTPSSPTLPQTGQLNWPVPVLAALGLLLFACGWVMKRQASE